MRADGKLMWKRLEFAVRVDERKRDGESERRKKDFGAEHKIQNSVT